LHRDLGSIHLLFRDTLLLLLLLLHRTLYLHDLSRMLVFRPHPPSVHSPTRQLTSIFLLSLLSVISLMLPSMRLLHNPKSQRLSRSQLILACALVHFAANVFQTAVDCALRLGGVLLQQDGADKLVDVCIIGE
jgi:hypothetical protein